MEKIKPQRTAAVKIPVLCGSLRNTLRNSAVNFDIIRTGRKYWPKTTNRSGL
jgi:hypothetical protein